MAPRRSIVGILLAACLVVTACGGTIFDPQGPCTVDGRAEGAYPELEALVPRELDGRPPDRLDSGRNCSDQNLGTLAAEGIDEVRFAGGLWELGERSGLTLAVLAAAGLGQAMVADFYESGARSGRRTEDVRRTEMRTAGGTWDRIDTLNDESFQTIVVMQPRPTDDVRIVLVGSDIRETVSRAAHDERVERGVAAWEAQAASD